jgi:hypothetical protein
MLDQNIKNAGPKHKKCTRNHIKIYFGAKRSETNQLTARKHKQQETIENNRKQEQLVNST